MNRWQRRIERAEELAREYPVSAELLYFYRDIAKFQSGVKRSPAEDLEPLLELIRQTAPDPLAQAAHLPVTWDELLRSADPLHAFFARVLLQAFAEPAPDMPAGGTVCPVCEARPVAAVLRPEGDGGKRFLLCSQCLGEWEFRRLLCPGCGEEDQTQLPVFTAEEFPHVRVEACDQCRVYLKAIDLTKNGLAVPEVDELASVALDIWATERGYTKLQTNLFGL
jgi:FdhE protein